MHARGHRFDPVILHFKSHVSRNRHVAFLSENADGAGIKLWLWTASDHATLFVGKPRTSLASSVQSRSLRSNRLIEGYNHRPVGQRCEASWRLKQACFSRSGIRENSFVCGINQNSYEFCYKNTSQRSPWGDGRQDRVEPADERDAGVDGPCAVPELVHRLRPRPRQTRQPPPHRHGC